MIRLFEFFVKRSFLVNLITGMTIILGLFVLSVMQRDLIPPMDFKAIRINTSLLGANPEEIEKYVTFLIEDALKGMPGVEKITSTSSNASSEILVKYRADFDEMEEALTTVSARVNAVRSRLPQEVRDISIQPAKLNSAFLFWLAVEGVDQLNTEHRQFVRELEEAFLRTQGVMTVESGLRPRHVHLRFKPEALRRYELSIPEVRELVHRHLRMTPIGTTQVGFEQISVELERSVSDITDLRRLPIEANQAGYQLTLDQVADVDWVLTREEERSYTNGKPDTWLDIRKNLHSDIVDLKNKGLSIIESFNARAPEGLRIVNMVDGPFFIEQQIRVLVKNGALGFVLVLLALMIFMSVKTAMMTALGLPVAYFGTLIVLYSLGIKIDLMSIVGMILVVGILVDDAIIVSERYVTLLRQGLQPRAAAAQAASDLFLPVTATMATTLIAFAPMLLMKSDISAMMKAVPIVVISALFVSWLESFFMLPNHLGHFVNRVKTHRFDLAFERVERFYVNSLRIFLKLRYLVVLVAISFVGLSFYVGAKKLKHNFNLNIDSERISLQFVLKKSSSVDESYRVLKPYLDELEPLFKQDFENTQLRMGKIWDNGQRYRGAKYARISAFIDRTHPAPGQLKLELRDKYQKLVDEMIKANKNHPFKEVRVKVEQHGGDELLDQIVSVRIEGGEDYDFDEFEQTILNLALKLPSIKEYAKDEERFQRAWRFLPSKEAFSLYNLDPLSLSQQIRSFFAPDEIIELRLGGEKISVFTDKAQDKDWKLTELKKIELRLPSGASVPLQYLGEWREKVALQKIQHLNGQRHLTLNFRIQDQGSNMLVAKQELNQIIEPLRAKYPLSKIKVLEADEQAAATSKWALKVAIACVLGVLFVIALLLNSLTLPLLVGLPIPFGLAGIFIALYLHDLPLGLMALVGLVGTIGVAVNSSIVMVDEMNRLALSQKMLWSAEVVLKGAISRFKAIFITTLTTLIGVMPMAYSIGGESGFTQPLAFSMGWGLGFAAIATLFVLPAFILVRADLFSLAKMNSAKKTLRGQKSSTQKPSISIQPSPSPSIGTEELHPSKRSASRSSAFKSSAGGSSVRPDAAISESSPLEKKYLHSESRPTEIEQ